MEPPNVGGKKGLSDLNVSLLGESLLFPSWGAGSLLLLRRYDYRASTLLCLWAQGADLKCVGDLEGGLKGRGTRNYLLANQNHWLLSFITPLSLPQSPCLFKIEQSLQLADRA